VPNLPLDASPIIRYNRITMMTIRNTNGREFFVHVIYPGDAYGLGDKLHHAGPDPMIEFYDMTYAGQTFGPRGQFVTRYYATTLAGCVVGQGITLDGGVTEWFVDGAALAPVIALAAEIAVACGTLW
jgi:hypothetical protein